MASHHHLPQQSRRKDFPVEPCFSAQTCPGSQERAQASQSVMGSHPAFSACQLWKFRQTPYNLPEP